MHIMVVDDHPHISSIMKSVLLGLGIGRVTSERNGEEAFKSFCRNRHDMIITDLMMEPVSGLELAAMVRHNELSPNPYVPIVAMTGYSFPVNAIKARDVGITEFLVKPFNGKTIQSRLEQVINKPREFIEEQGYFGPDRRRIKLSDPSAQFKRATDIDDTQDAYYIDIGMDITNGKQFASKTNRAR